MIKNTITYNYFNLLYQSKHWVVFCFVLFLGIKPMVDINSIFTNTKFELTENITLENSEEKENESLCDDDHEKFFNPLNLSKIDYKKQSLSYFKFHKSHLKISPDIHLPPPKL